MFGASLPTPQSHHSQFAAIWATFCAFTLSAGIDNLSFVSGIRVDFGNILIIQCPREVWPTVRR